MLFKDFIDIILKEEYRGNYRTKPLINAINNRYTVTFYYSGPLKPKKFSVKRGTRYNAKVVALGLTKKGKMAIRAYVQPPSTSKKGFEKHGWRTFLVSRMSNIQINQNEIWEDEPPLYKEGDDDSFTVTYASLDWNKIPKLKKEPIIVSLKRKEPKTSTTLPQPKQKNTIDTTLSQSKQKNSTDTILPQPKQNDNTTTTQPIDTTLPQPKQNDNTTTTQPIDTTLPQPKEKNDTIIKSNETKPSSEPLKTDITSSDNIKSSLQQIKQELPQPKKKDKPPVNVDDKNKEEYDLQENIKQIKRLILKNI